MSLNVVSLGLTMKRQLPLNSIVSRGHWSFRIHIQVCQFKLKSRPFSILHRLNLCCRSISTRLSCVCCFAGNSHRFNCNGRLAIHQVSLTAHSSRLYAHRVGLSPYCKEGDTRDDDVRPCYEHVYPLGTVVPRLLWN